MPRYIEKAIEELSKFSGITLQQLDFSLKSLDLLSKKIRELGIENNEHKIVDGLVAYCGEIIRRTIQGQWRH